MIRFNSDFYVLGHDTIYRQGLARAVVVKVDRRYYEMTVRDLDSGVEGVYVSTESMFED